MSPCAIFWWCLTWNVQIRPAGERVLDLGLQGALAILATTPSTVRLTTPVNSVFVSARRAHGRFDQIAHPGLYPDSTAARCRRPPSMRRVPLPRTAIISRPGPGGSQATSPRKRRCARRVRWRFVDLPSGESAYLPANPVRAEEHPESRRTGPGYSRPKAPAKNNLRIERRNAVPGRSTRSSRSG